MNKGIAAARIGGKGTPRRKQAKKPAVRSAQPDEKKLQAATKKLGVQPITSIEEVNLFQDDGNIIHFKRPTVKASVPCNTFIVSGDAQVKELTELIPGILDQLGSVSINSLKKFASAYRQEGEAEEGEGEEVPTLVQDVEAVEAAEGSCQ